MLMRFLDRPIVNQIFFKKKGKILAIGDSLTVGLYDISEVQKSHPYTILLERLLSNDSGIKHFYSVVNAGINGQRAKQIKKRLIKHLSEEFLFDLVIILAGTNDYLDILRNSKSRKQNFEQHNLICYELANQILSLHTLCHSHSVKTALLTIPEVKNERFNGSHFRRNKVCREIINAKLEQFTEQHSKNTILVDLADFVSKVSDNVKESKTFWADGVHFTPIGYDKMAEFVYASISRYL